MSTQSSHSVEWVELGTLATGSPLRFPIHTIRGSQSGPTVGISSGIHGDEVPPIDAIRRVVGQLNPAELHGTLRIMPVANPLALEGITRHTPQDMQNLNRVFPGDPNGWVTEQLADAIVSHFLPGLDALIDLHAGGSFPTVDYVYISNDEALSRSLGFRVMFRPKPGFGFPHTMGGSAAEQGTRVAVVEMGGGMTADEEYIHKGVDGIFNALRHLGSLPGDARATEGSIVVDEMATLRPRQGGLLVPEVKVGDLGRIVPKGTLLGRVYSPYTFEELERFEAPFDRTVLILLRGSVTRVQPGDYGYMLGRPERG